MPNVIYDPEMTTNDKKFEVNTVCVDIKVQHGGSPLANCTVQLLGSAFNSNVIQLGDFGSARVAVSPQLGIVTLTLNRVPPDGAHPDLPTINETIANVGPLVENTRINIIVLKCPTV